MKSVDERLWYDRKETEWFWGLGGLGWNVVESWKSKKEFLNLSVRACMRKTNNDKLTTEI